MHTMASRHYVGTLKYISNRIYFISFVDLYLLIDDATIVTLMTVT